MSRLPLLLFSTLLAACATVAPAPAGLAAGPYTTTIVAADIPAGAPADMAAGEVGIWQFTVAENGHALVSFNGQQVVDAPLRDRPAMLFARRAVKGGFI